MNECGNVFMYSTRYSCWILIKLEFSRQIFEQLKYRISSKSVQWKPSCSMRTDGHEASKKGVQMSTACMYLEQIRIYRVYVSTADAV